MSDASESSDVWRVVQPDHKAAPDIVVTGVFCARLPKWRTGTSGASSGVRYAGAFRARRPLLVDDPTVFGPVGFG